MASILATGKRQRSIGKGDPRGSSTESDSDEDDNRHERRKLRECDMPWSNRANVSVTPQNPSCDKTASIIKQLNVDIKSAKLHIRLERGAPRGIPMSEWEHIFRGEAVDLDKILSSLHRVTIDPERKARIGETEIT